MNFSKRAVTFLVTIGISIQVFAEKDRGGGHAVSCPGQPLQMLDQYEADLLTPSGQRTTIDISGLSASAVVDLFRERLRSLPFPFNGLVLLDAFDKTVFIDNMENWVDGEPKYYDDSGEPYRLCPTSNGSTTVTGQKIQVAYQVDGTVFFNRAAIALLPQHQLGVLRVHERLLYIFKKWNPEAIDSQPVRSLYRVVMHRAPYPELISSAMNAFNPKVPKTLVGQRWENKAWGLRIDDLDTSLRTVTFRMYRMWGKKENPKGFMCLYNTVYLDVHHLISLDSGLRGGQCFKLTKLRYTFDSEGRMVLSVLEPSTASDPTAATRDPHAAARARSIKLILSNDFSEFKHEGVYPQELYWATEFDREPLSRVIQPRL